MSDRNVIESADTLAAPLAPDAPGTPENRFDAAQPKLAERYELCGLLGVGGMGAVYRVRDVELGEIIALKMLRPELVGNATALERFRQEVRLARRVTHANVARTFDIGEHDGQKFLTMECVDGGSLASRIAERGVLDQDEAVAIAESICAGLSAAHQAGVVHRDLKPENVLIAKDGRVVVTDFGIAVASGGSDNAIIGTPAYMAPEQLVPPAVVDFRADIYALGAILFEMLTGERAWKGDAPMLLLVERARATSPPDPRAVRKSVGDALAVIVTRCMAISPAARFASAAEIARALRDAAVSAHSTMSARPAPLPLPAREGKTVAVLPFANEGAASDNYIADGLTSDLIDTLSMTRGLLVRPRSVVAKLDRGERALLDIGRELGVQVIVEGSVRRSGDTLRVGVRLIGTNDGYQLWAQRFDATVSDLLIVSDAAANEIATALTTELPSHADAPPTDPAAIELFFRAKEEFWRTWSRTAKSATAMFERALVLSPEDPRMVAATAHAYTRMVLFGEGDRAANVARGIALAERAIAMAPALGEPWAALASHKLNSGDAVGAARAARTGLAHAPNSAVLQDMIGHRLAETLELDEALLRLEIALKLDPTLFSARWGIARVCALRGEWDRTDAILETIPESAQQRMRLALWRRKTFALAPPEPNSYARVHADLAQDGRLTKEHRDFMLARATGESGRLRTLLLQRNIELLAFAGEVDQVFETLDLAVGADLTDLAWIDRCPLFDPFRADARWARARAIVGERSQKILEALRPRAA